jgi:hypothetical protein
MTDTKEITISENQTAIGCLNEPQYSIAQMVAQRESILLLMKKVLKDGEHYGKIPGCGEKKTLLKSGAEKICSYFGLSSKYDIKKNSFPNGHIEYEIICTLTHRGTGQEVGQGVGSCSTMESKWRFRKAGRKCPVCNNENTIIKGKEEFGGGWVCYKAKGGCNAKFKDGDVSIEGQKVGRVEHDNPADYYNTCLKMGKKRAFVDATLIGVAASDLFTQDVEEMVENGVVPQAEPVNVETKKEKMPAADVKTYLAQMEKAQTAEEIKKIADEALDKAKSAKDGAAFTKIANAKNKCVNALIVANEDVPL